MYKRQLHCSIDELGGNVFSLSIYMPDKNSARLAREQFIENGAEIYKLLLAAFTGNDKLIHDISEGITL